MWRQVLKPEAFYEHDLLMAATVSL